MSNKLLHLYNSKNVKNLLSDKCIGVYRLYKYLDGKHEILYVGRSDTCISRRLCNHPYLKEADYFDYDILDSPEKAFLLESAYFHSIKEMKNIIHPAIPKGSDISCPFCGYGKQLSC